MSTYIDTNKQGKAVYSSITHGKGTSSIPPCPECNTHHKEQYMHTHYSITLTTRTTMVWMAMFTMLTLLFMVPFTLTTEGMGIHTLSMVGVVFSLMCTLCMGITHWYVRTHHQVVLSTRALDMWS